MGSWEVEEYMAGGPRKNAYKLSKTAPSKAVVAYLTFESR
jgi:hypothetical protein